MPYTKKPRMTTKARIQMSNLKKDLISRAKVAAIAKQVVNKQIETKKSSHERTEVSLSTLGGIENQSLVNTTVGGGHGQRDGHMLQPVGIDLRGHIKNNTTSPIIVKVMIIRVKNNEAVPALDFLETNVSNTDLTTGDLSTMYRRVNTDSYQVLMSRTMKIGVQEDNVKMFKMYLNMKKMRKLIYEGLADSQPKYGRIQLLAFGRGTGNDGENLTYELSYNSTFYFKDA